MTSYVPYLMLILAELSIGASIVLTKSLIEHVPTYDFCFVRFAGSSLLLFLILVSSGSKIFEDHHSFRRRDGVKFLELGLSGGFLFNLFFTWGLEYTTASSAGIIAASLPALIGIMAYVLLRERIPTLKWFAIGLTIIGIAVLTYDNAGGHGSLAGDGLVVLSMIPEAYYTIVTRQVRSRLTPLGCALITNLTSTLLFCFLIDLSSMGAFLDLDIARDMVGVWILSAVFFWGWSKGVKTVSASSAALFTGIMPLTVVVLAGVFLQERLTPGDGLGMILVLGALFLGRKL